MATRIRFARGGSKKRPFYRLVAADVRAPRDGNFIEKLGTYNPLLANDDQNRFSFNKERVEYWLKTGAAPSEKVAIFLWDSGFKNVEKFLPRAFPKSATERQKIREEKLAAEKKKAEEAKKAAEAEAKKQAEEEAANNAKAEASAAEATETPAPEAENAAAPESEAKEEAQATEAEATAEEAKEA